MDILTVCGKPYPQKVVLDTDVLTRSGELFPAGSEIFVLLCVKPLFCTDARCYHNVNLSRRNDTEEKVYINPESEELILDTQYKDKTYNTVEELCEDHGYNCEVTGDRVITHPYTQKDIATLIGTSRPTLNSILNELKEEKILSYSRKEIRLLNKVV